MAISSKFNSGEAFAEENLWSTIPEPENIDLSTWTATYDYDPGVYTSDTCNIVEKKPKRNVNQWRGGYQKRNYNTCNQRRNYNSQRR